MAIARHVTVFGRVQGVFYRAWTKEQAGSLRISGWVRNCPDGSVEALVAGEESAVRAMIERMGRGPPGATVNRLIEKPSDEPQDQGFTVRH